MELLARVQSAKANRVSAKARRLRINTKAEHDHVLVVGEPKARHPPFKMRGAASPGPAGKVTIFGQMNGAASSLSQAEECGDGLTTAPLSSSSGGLGLSLRVSFAHCSLGVNESLELLFAGYSLIWRPSIFFHPAYTPCEQSLPRRF